MGARFIGCDSKTDHASSGLAAKFGEEPAYGLVSVPSIYSGM